MSRIKNTFAALSAQGKKGLIPFMTAGDPDPARTVETLLVYLYIRTTNPAQRFCRADSYRPLLTLGRSSVWSPTPASRGFERPSTRTH